MSDWFDPNLSTRNPYNIQEAYTNYKETKGIPDQPLNWSAFEDIIEYLKAATAWIADGANDEPPNPRQFQKRLPL